MKKVLIAALLLISITSISEAQWGSRNTTVAVGEVSGSVTAVQLPTVSGTLCAIKAVNSNAGDVYVGGAGVTVVNGTTDITSGIELAAGETTGWIPCGNLNTFYIITDNAGDDITYMVIN